MGALASSRPSASKADAQRLGASAASDRDERARAEARTAIARSTPVRSR